MDVRRRQEQNFLVKYLLSCAAATVAETATYPLDLTKTRLQLQGEVTGRTCSKASSSTHRLSGGVKTASSTAYRGMFKTGMGIEVRTVQLVKKDCCHCGAARGPLLFDIMIFSSVYTGCRMVVYERLRERVFHRDEHGNFALWKAMCCGMIGGAVAQFLASPTDLVKVRLQMEGQRRLNGLPPRVHGMTQALREVLATRGVFGLWAGWLPNVQRAALVNMADLATYDKVKHLLLSETPMQDNYVTHAASSACSGLAAATASTPADVVKTRIMNQPTDPISGRGELYRSSLDCLLKTVKAEGVLALYKGFVPIWARMAPWSLTFWLSYEKIRWLTGDSSF